MPSRIAEVFSRSQDQLLKEWTENLSSSVLRRDALMKESELREQCSEFLRLMNDAFRSGAGPDDRAPQWAPVREFLGRISRTRGAQGFTPSETAAFVFSLKRPVFTRLRQEHGKDAEGLAEDVQFTEQLMDGLGLFTTEIHQKAREEVILRQQQEMLELSVPVVKLWDGVVALPLIGTLDSNRTQVVMESLLQRIVETGSEVAIIDITGVPTVDTLTAQHLIKTVTATRLMGAECVISGIRPQIAQTIVHLGVDLADVVTKASLAGAFEWALKRMGASVNRSKLLHAKI